MSNGTPADSAPNAAPESQTQAKHEEWRQKDVEVLAEFAEENAKPLATNGYKVDLVQGLVRQALTRLAS